MQGGGERALTILTGANPLDPVTRNLDDGGRRMFRVHGEAIDFLKVATKFLEQSREVARALFVSTIGRIGKIREKITPTSVHCNSRP